MSMRRCQFCGAALYGRSDKRYCTSTCRRDASRVPQRTVRIGSWTFFGSEVSQWNSIEDVLIPRLERELGPNHRAVHEARRRAEQLRDAKWEEMGRELRRMSYAGRTGDE
jgi:hypothetical protein